MKPLETYNLVVSTAEVQLIGAALSELPFKVSAQLINSLQAQVTEQERAAAEPKTSEVAEVITASNGPPVIYTADTLPDEETE